MPRQTMEFLNSKERKLLYKQLAEQYGYAGPTDWTWFQAGNKKYYLITRDVEAVPEELPVMQGGLYVAQEMSDGIRLSMDGAITLGKYCSAERITVTPEQRDRYLKGEEVEVGEEDTPWRIVMCGDDVLGCSKVKDGWVLNYTPKGRWILDPHDQ